MRYLYVNTSVEQRIEDLKRHGRAGRTSARKAEEVLSDIRAGKVLSHVDSADRCTNYGEKRIKGCRKYDIGSGFRLITIQRGGDIFVPYLGDHDECRRWLENHSRLKKAEFGSLGAPIRCEDCEAADGCDAALSGGSSDVYGRELTEQELRIVFRGLIESRTRA